MSDDLLDEKLTQEAINDEIYEWHLTHDREGVFVSNCEHCELGEMELAAESAPDEDTLREMWSLERKERLTKFFDDGRKICEMISCESVPDKLKILVFDLECCLNILRKELL